MPRRARLVCLVLLFSVAAAASGQSSEDLRKRFNTRSLEAAKAIGEAIELSNARKPQEALRAIETALKADASCQMAHFWHALVLSDMGNLDRAFEAYKRCVDLRDPERPNVTVEACINVGLMHGKLQAYEECWQWLSRAVLEDPEDRARLRYRAYKNLAVTLRHKGSRYAAALAARAAHEADSEKVGREVVSEFVSGVEKEEAGQVLYRAAVPAAPTKRTAPGDMRPVELPEAFPGERIEEFLPDPAGRFVVVLPYVLKEHERKDRTYYYVFQGDAAPRVKKVEMGQEVRCGCLVSGRLFLVLGGPPRLCEVDVPSGAVRSTLALGDYAPKNVAVLPSRGVAYFPRDSAIHRLDLGSGEIQSTKRPAIHVRADPREEYLYAIIKPEFRATPFYFVEQPSGTTLFVFRVLENALVLAAVRENAASNGYEAVLSPDGRWVTVPGGGGWRPQYYKGTHGYGAAIFACANVEHLQGFFGSRHYSQGVAINPVTNQVAVVASETVHVYDMADPTIASLQINRRLVDPEGKVRAEPKTLQTDRPAARTENLDATYDKNRGSTSESRFGRACAWSGDGRFLLLAGPEGLVVYENPLTPEEKQYAATWHQSVKPTATVAARPPSAQPPTIKPIPGLAAFKPQSERTGVERALAVARRSGRTDALPGWRQHKPYVQNEESAALVGELGSGQAGVLDAGVAIYRLRNQLKKDPSSVPLHYQLARYLKQSGQNGEAQPLFEDVVRADSGRTELTTLSLKGLADIATAQEDEMKAIFCLAVSLTVDQANPATLRTIVPLLKKHGFAQDSTALADLMEGMPSVDRGLPQLPVPPSEARKLPATVLYQLAAPAVVLIRAGEARGSGMVVGRADTVLTNAHVIGSNETVRVFPFAFKDGRLVKLDGVAAEVIYRSTEMDAAVLRLEAPLAGVVPLWVSDSDPAPGDKVYAIGNPGMGEKVLEQSISEGIVSAGNREIKGQTLLQHTAAVNPGNSGGPLLDEEGRVVGMNTLKAGLEGVGFAVPARQIRKVFQSPAP